jgi:hypothetical protein
MRIIDNGDSAVATSSGLGQGEACGGPRREQDVKMQHQDKHGDKINWEISKQNKNNKNYFVWGQIWASCWTLADFHLKTFSNYISVLKFEQHSKTTKTHTFIIIISSFFFSLRMIRLQ